MQRIKVEQNNLSNGNPKIKRIRVQESIGALKLVKRGTREGGSDCLPPGAVILILGQSPQFKSMVDISWKGSLYAVYQDDLKARTAPTSAHRARQPGERKALVSALFVFTGAFFNALFDRRAGKK